MAQKFANAARAVLAAGIASGDTTVTIVSGGALFPEIVSPDFARAVLQDESGIEIVLITAHTASATSFTVTRAQEGTTARSFGAGSIFGIRVTAADMDEALDAVNLASEVTGTLSVANGGTGATSLAANNVILGNGTDAVQVVAPGASGNVLTSNGTTWTSAVPTAGGVTLDDVQTLTNKTLVSPVVNTQISLGTAGRIVRDFTTDQTPLFVTSTSNQPTIVVAEPNGTGTGSLILVKNSSNPTTYQYGRVAVGPSRLEISAGGTGGAADLPLRLSAGGNSLTLGINGDLSINAVSVGTAGQVLTSGGAANNLSWTDIPVTLTNSVTLTNKTLTSPAITSGTASGLTLNDGYTEEIFAVTGTTPALSPTNGSIQTWTLTGNSTPTAGTWAAGQSITLMINDGTAFTVTWTSLAVVWVGGTAPTLATTGFTVIVLWKVGTTIYGALTGQVA